jgi:hypothetical protein
MYPEVAKDAPPRLALKRCVAETMALGLSSGEGASRQRVWDTRLAHAGSVQVLALSILALSTAAHHPGVILTMRVL